MCTVIRSVILFKNLYLQMYVCIGVACENSGALSPH